jgi:amino acid adenylation domain-containing protein
MTLVTPKPSQIPKRADTDHPPLSFAQSRLWFLDQFEPGMTAYNVVLAYKLIGGVNKSVLEQCFNEIAKRHEILRTTFSIVNEEPVQIISPDLRLPLQLINLRDIPPNQRGEEVHKIIKAETRFQFNLSKGPLIRTLILEFDDTKYNLLINMHHIVTDGWSSTILLKELSQLYDAYLFGKPSPLKALPIQYSDFASWQKTWLSGETLDHQLNYWRSKLEDIPNLNIPTDYTRPSLYSYEGAFLEAELPLSLKSQLEGLCKDENTTLFMVLLAAFQVLLHRYTGQDDIVVGTSIANRNHLDIENLIGFFVNSLVIRSDLSGNPTFREFLRQVRNTTLDAYTHQDIPFEKLVEEIKPERDLSRNPFFQTTFLLQNLPPSRLHLPGILVERIKIEGETSKFDLSVFVYEKEDALLIRIGYNINIFKAESIERILNHYQALLGQVTSNPDQKVEWYSFLLEKEKYLMIKTWNEAVALFPRNKCIHHLIEDWAEKKSDESCIEMEGVSITYSQLNSTANNLAQLLIELGVGPESTVGIILERSIDTVVSIVAILKAGGAYVPLDSLYPEERIIYMLEDANCKALVTLTSQKPNIPHLKIPTIFLDDISPCISGISNPITEVKQDNLAYIMYTSGSTGNPKGVLITHANVLGLLFGYKEVTQDGPRRVGTTVAPFNFDTSVEEIFSVLCFGGKLHIIPHDKSVDGNYFAEYLINHGITTTYIVPELLVPVAKHLKSDSRDISLRCLITGLAPKKSNQLQPFRELSADLKILNAYGPTEITYGATAYEFIKAEDPNKDVPIGVPYPNYRVYVVDKYLEPVPIGVKGELLIGGLGISRGYNKAPGLTAEKFIPDPFSGGSGQRLYKTGDIVRCQPDGNIEFLGRADDQVKIRGFRIELGEISSQLKSHPDVTQTLVTTHEVAPGDIRLIAYVQNKHDHSISIKELREFLEHRLPGYMVPNLFIILDNIPLLPNGKINRKALPHPDFSERIMDTKYQAPGSFTEKLVARFWGEVLGINNIGLKDNFFELGGHSLLATKIVSRIREVYKVELPFKVFFQEPTVEKVSNYINNQDVTNGRSEKISEILLKIKSMSDEEIQEAIRNKKAIHHV